MIYFHLINSAYLLIHYSDNNGTSCHPQRSIRMFVSYQAVYNGLSRKHRFIDDLLEIKADKVKNILLPCNFCLMTQL